MACRPVYLIALLLALIFLQLPACRQTPRTSFSLLQSAVAGRNLHVAIYRFWSGAIPFCEQFYQFTDQHDAPVLNFNSEAICGEQLASLRGCRRQLSASIQSHNPDEVWKRIDGLAQSSNHQNCRDRDNSLAL
jgi:hypothetical protein